MSDKMRGEFEAWAISSAWLGLGEESQMDRDESGEGYNEIEVHTAWLAELGDVIECMYAFGADKGITWSEPKGQMPEQWEAAA